MALCHGRYIYLLNDFVLVSPYQDILLGCTITWIIHVKSCILYRPVLMSVIILEHRISHENSGVRCIAHLNIDKSQRCAVHKLSRVVPYFRLHKPRVGGGCSLWLLV